MSAAYTPIAHPEVPALPTPDVPALPQDVDLAEYALGDTPRPRRTSKRIERATRRAEAFALRRNGVSTATIAQHLGVHPRTVSTWIREAIQAIPEEDVAAIRKMELERLDAILAPQMRLALAGDGLAVDRVLRIMERRARLLGLDDAKPGGFEQVGALLDRLVLGE
ncbi:helix-turn-helix domain-containing protein [Microbacterium esteraromaticum]|uniref:helix-turn-helix domain-containing protein n=1 Tax=Microbacterium esteraromaticum TaxID=57043 RepID=UPI001A8E6A05|nr:helix-turn-helix domain-containing protein [Microbacterium esteraromaticum]MBN8424999.1 helix-turn-helix domain-containing protein [Microbacterium esteraromaticum]